MAEQVNPALLQRLNKAFSPYGGSVTFDNGNYVLHNSHLTGLNLRNPTFAGAHSEDLQLATQSLITKDYVAGTPNIVINPSSIHDPNTPWEAIAKLTTGNLTRSESKQGMHVAKAESGLPGHLAPNRNGHLLG